MPPAWGEIERDAGGDHWPLVHDKVRDGGTSAGDVGSDGERVAGARAVELGGGIGPGVVASSPRASFPSSSSSRAISDS